MKNLKTHCVVAADSPERDLAIKSKHSSGKARCSSNGTLWCFLWPWWWWRTMMTKMTLMMMMMMVTWSLEGLAMLVLLHQDQPALGWNLLLLLPEHHNVAKRLEKGKKNCTAPLPHSFLHHFHYHKTYLFKSIVFQWEIHPNQSHTYLKFHENLCHQRLVNPVHRVLGQPLVLVDLHHPILGPAIYRLKEGRMQKEKGKVWYFTKLPSDPNPWFFSP